MTPMPPACAMAMASRDSVTVSMAAEMIGRLRSMSRAMRVRYVDIAGHDFGMAGLQQHVVKGQGEIAGGCFDDAGHCQSCRCWNGFPRARARYGLASGVTTPGTPMQRLS